MRPAELTAPQTVTGENDRRTLVQRRTDIEARLIAHACGWRALDEVRLRRLRRALADTLAALGRQDPAEALIRGDTPEPIRS